MIDAHHQFRLVIALPGIGRDKKRLATRSKEESAFVKTTGSSIFNNVP
jgi:hypothetical protein